MPRIRILLTAQQYLLNIIQFYHVVRRILKNQNFSCRNRGPKIKITASEFNGGQVYVLALITR